jgi:hypothetical protein
MTMEQMIKENPKAFMTDAEIAAEDESLVTHYLPNSCSNGYTVFSFEAGPPQTRLIDMNGNIVNTWRQRCERAKLVANGHLLIVGSTGRQILELDWTGKVVWEFMAPGTVHHDGTRLENGNTVFLYREPVPQVVCRTSKDPERAEMRLVADAIMEVTPEGDIVFEWHQYEHFDIDWFKPTNRLNTDWTHTNTVNCLPENHHWESGDSRFEPGNYLISMRSLDTIMIVSRRTGEIVWQYSGGYRGGLSGQHEPNMIPKGRPGAGNILIFDNGVEEAHHGASIVLEINPATTEVQWTFEADDFFSGYRSTVERLPNGNTLINEADRKRMFEVTSQGELVWEYQIPIRWRVGRCHRVPYDFVAILADLPLPTETRIDGPIRASRPKPVYAPGSSAPLVGI